MTEQLVVEKTPFEIMRDCYAELLEQHRENRRCAETDDDKRMYDAAILRYENAVRRLDDFHGGSE